MTAGTRRDASPYRVLGYPTLMLGVFFLGPFGIMVAVSFFHRIPGGFYEPAFELANYARFFTPLFVDHLVLSMYIAVLVAVICVSIGFPFTYVLTRLSRRTQVMWLVFLLSVLSLSEVIVAFSWSVLLSRTAGVSNLLVWAGLMGKPSSWTPGFPATLLGLTYLAFPYTVLMLYPPLSRLDPELSEAARTMGASPLRTFFTVVVPVLRPAILASLIMVFVFVLGAYLIPQILGRPQHWTLSVLITDQAIYQSNLPFAAAMAVFLLAASLGLIALTLGIGRRAGLHA
jgi:putative spermidine/putrescine transport system permease protein